MDRVESTLVGRVLCHSPAPQLRNSQREGPSLEHGRDANRGAPAAVTHACHRIRPPCESEQGLEHDDHDNRGVNEEQAVHQCVL